MRCKQLIILFFIFSCISISPFTGLCQPFPFKFNYLTVDEGLSHTDVNDICQDRFGYIWMATYFGINRFDGYSIKKYYNNNVPKDNAFKNRVRCISAGDDGRIWLGTEDGLQCFDPNTERYIDFPQIKKHVDPPFSKLIKLAGKSLYGLTGEILRAYSVDGDQIIEEIINVPEDVRFSDIAVDQTDVVYLTSNKGLWCLDKRKKLERLAINGLSDPALSRLAFNKNQDLLVARNARLMLLSKDIQRSAKHSGLVILKSFEASGNTFISDILHANNGDYWINFGEGLFRLDHNLNPIQKIDNESYLNALNSKSLTKAIIDRSECLWTGAFGGGVNYCDLNQKQFYTIQRAPGNPNSLSSNHIRSVLEDGENLWIGTNSSGLDLFNFRTKQFRHYNTYNTSIKLRDNGVAALVLDNDHNLWIGNGSGIEVLQPRTNSLLQPKGYKNFPNFSIETLAKDCYGNIWFGNHQNNYGVIWKDSLNNFHVKYYDEGYFILADRDNPQLMISSTRGLKRVIIDKQGNIIKTFNYTSSSKPYGLTSDYTYPICKQNNNLYWVGTIGGGLNRLELNPKTNRYRIKAYSNNIGVFYDVESMEIDDNGNIWLGGNGLERLDPKAGKLIRYDKNDGLQGNSFKVGASYKGAEGKLYFGGINGLNYFYPDKIRTSRVKAQPVLTDILINNQKPDYGTSDTLKNSIKEAIGYSEVLTLNYLQNNFIISFSSMNFANPLKSKYRYKLVGFDNNWRFTDGKNPTAAYSNLDFKTYKFLVEATNSDGIWSNNQAQLDIIITPPWWKSGIAKVIYGLLFVSFLAGIYIYQARWYRLKREIEVREINEKKREEMHQQRTELYQQQLQFFTNISHEFRTPLTLVLGPLESLMSQNNNTALQNSYLLMQRSTKRLMNLVSELMNFRKVADSIIKLRVQPVEINKFCNDLAFEFHDLAEGKGINFNLADHTEINPDEVLTNYFDIQILEKILLNLLHNAFKYTDPGGNISLDISFELESFKPAFKNEFQILNKDYRAEKYIYFGISDSGVGISGDSIDKIFDRYYRISRNHLGSGIGLALVKSLTRLHKGDIYVYSEHQKGTKIIIGLPWGKENYISSEIATQGTELEPQLEPIENSVLLSQTIETNNTENSKVKKNILLVDDNDELRIFLKQTLGSHYCIHEASDGENALKIAVEKVPDLIISDVMMPVMDGIEFCRLVKEQFETSHIPFIILSARDTLDSKIEGMGSGADFYFGKPLSIDLLLLTVQNIFEQNEKLKQRYTNDYLAEATELVHNEKDKEFLQKLLDIIEENIQDPSLDVDFLCKHLYISRTKLYQKIKSVSDQSVGDFIRTIRLKKAIQIMTHEDVTMNEVVDRIGLQSSSNFSRAFKKEYGKSPLQYIKSLKRTTG